MTAIELLAGVGLGVLASILVALALAKLPHRLPQEGR